MHHHISALVLKQANKGTWCLSYYCEPFVSPFFGVILLSSLVVCFFFVGVLGVRLCGGERMGGLQKMICIEDSFNSTQRTSETPTPKDNNKKKP